MNQFKYRETRSTTYGRRAFPVTGPMAWNSLPDFIRDPTSSTDCFRHRLKTSIHVQNIKLKSYLVQKLQWKETDGRTRPIALLCLVTRPVITQCSLARPIWRWRGLMPNCYGGLFCILHACSIYVNAIICISVTSCTPYPQCLYADIFCNYAPIRSFSMPRGFRSLEHTRPSSLQWL